jgi:hypothetical protein
MLRSISLFGLASAVFLASSGSALALVIAGPIKPGGMHFGYDWPEKEAFSDLLKIRPCVGGHYIDAPTWWDGHYAATYLIRGNEADLQKQIDRLDQLKLPGTTVLIHEGEGFDDPNKFFGNTEVVCYDWKLTLSETKNTSGRHKLLPGMNERQVMLVIHLGTRLDRTRLKIPEWMKPQVLGLDDSVKALPADALHALARAARED